MSGEIRKVNLVGINKEGIKADPHFPNRIFFPLKLSTYPDSRWVALFRDEYEKYGYSKKGFFREQRHDEIVLDIGEDDDLQTHCNIVKEVIEATNKAVERENVKIAAEDKKREEENQRRKEKLDRLKEKADKVKM
jgi:hypothetical protein